MTWLLLLVLVIAYWRGGLKAAFLIVLVVALCYIGGSLTTLGEQVFERIEYQTNRGLEMIGREP